MTWETILKLYDGRKFLEDLKEKLGGEIKGGYKRTTKGRRVRNYFEAKLLHDKGSIEVNSNAKNDGRYTVRVNGEVINVTPVYNLKDVMEMTMKATEIRKALSSRQSEELDQDNDGDIDGDDFAILRRGKTFEKVAKEVDFDEAATAASLSDLKEQLKNAPKYIQTALSEIERYLKGE